MRTSSAFLAACGCAGLLACASSSGSNATFSPNPSSGAGGSSGTGAAGPKSASSASSSMAASSSGAMSGSSGSGGAGGTGGFGGTGGGGVGGSACDYSAPNTCDQALVISMINGDTGNDTRVVNGTTSDWFKVMVHEGNNLPHSLSYKALLQSPPGMQFDLYAYPGNVTAPDCLGTPLAATGTPESVSDSWSDSFGSDDSRWVAFEVRYVSGTACGPTARWTLTVQGNPP